jgi:hypothetical protein
MADCFSSRNICVPLLLGIAFRTLVSGLLSLQTIFRGEQCTRVRSLAPAKAGGSGRVVADIAKLSVGREAYLHPRAGHQPRTVSVWPRRVPRPVVRRCASTLGLEGEASVAGFQAMFEGRDPTTGDLLGRPHGRNAVPAFDLVLRPTKSVSILYGLGDRPPDAASGPPITRGLAEAVGYLDEHLGGRRGHGGVQHVAGEELLAVGFDHRTSREGDPLVHTHLVIANRVQGPDGRWTALDGRRPGQPGPGPLPRRLTACGSPLKARMLLAAPQDGFLRARSPSTGAPRRTAVLG